MPQSRRNSRSLYQAAVSLVLPVFNEVQVLEQLTAALQEVMADFPCRSEILFINDGSTDGSGQVLDDLADRQENVRVVHFSRNFGHQAALQAGLTYATGDAVIVMDPDCQDDPIAIGVFLDLWVRGYDVVYAIRTGAKKTL